MKVSNSIVFDFDESKVLSLINFLDKNEVLYEADTNLKSLLERHENKEFTFLDHAKNSLEIKQSLPTASKSYVNFIETISDKMVRSLYEHQLKAAYHMAFALNSCNFSVPGSGKTTIVYAAYTYLKSIKKIRPLGFQWQTQDPFLFCVHHEDHYPEGNERMEPKASLSGRTLGNDFELKDGWRMYHGDKVPGFPGHPHRGFETLTVVRKGMVDHADSAGGAGRYGDGDLQWMTAGKGLMHSEMFPLLKQEEKNSLELFQIWLNLPAKNKMVNPAYKMFWSEAVPNFNYENKAQIEVLVGSLFGKTAPTPPENSWAYEDENAVGVYNIILKPSQTIVLPKTHEGVNRTLYFYEGEGGTVNSEIIPSYHAVDVLSHHDLTLTAGSEEVKILVLQGRPINEPVVQHGPFVMNTREEIQAAFAEYQQTRFGGWPWERYDKVHALEKGRFARYVNGTEETP
jgi:redox-sensitive bicupin YhaK (pirin superfamily)